MLVRLEIHQVYHLMVLEQLVVMQPVAVVVEIVPVLVSDNRVLAVAPAALAEALVVALPVDPVAVAAAGLAVLAGLRQITSELLVAAVLLISVVLPVVP